MIQNFYHTSIVTIIIPIMIKMRDENDDEDKDDKNDPFKLNFMLPSINR